jgi:MFS family permease
LTFLRVLRNSPQYRALYIGQFVSTFGTALTYVVLPLQMYQLTRSPLDVGLLGVVEFFPMLMLAFAGGALADRFDRRRMIVVVELAMAACCGMLAWNAAEARPAPVWLWVMAAVLAGLNALHRPALEALTPQVVPPGEMSSVAALSSLRWSFAHIAGPGLAGLVAAQFGVSAAFALDGASYLFSVFCVLRMGRVARPPGAAETMDAKMWLEGWRYARTRPDLLGTYLVDMNAMFFGMPNALFPALGERWGVWSVGWLYSAPAVGTLIVSLTSGWTQRVSRHGRAITLAAAVWGVGIIGFGFSDPLWLALVCLALAGAADTVSGIFRMTMWNESIPARVRGRMAAIEMVSYLSGPYLGNAEAGLAARMIGLRGSVVSGGVLCVAGAAVIAALLPQFWLYDCREGRRLSES